MSAHGTAESKLANVVMTFELARRLQQRDICVFACHPGVLNTALWRDSPFGPVQKVWNLCCACKPTFVAGNSVAYVASGHGTCGMRHGYFQGCLCLCSGESIGGARDPSSLAFHVVLPGGLLTVDYDHTHPRALRQFPCGRRRMPTRTRAAWSCGHGPLMRSGKAARRLRRSPKLWTSGRLG